MYICMCNPFTDKDVNEHLESQRQKVTVSEAYSACSEGKSMNCCSCAPSLKKMVDTHNNTLTIEAINGQMEKASKQNKETV